MAAPNDMDLAENLHRKIKNAKVSQNKKEKTELIQFCEVFIKYCRFLVTIHS